MQNCAEAQWRGTVLDFRWKSGHCHRPASKNDAGHEMESRAYKIALKRNGAAFVLHQKTMQDMT